MRLVELTDVCAHTHTQTHSHTHPHRNLCPFSGPISPAVGGTWGVAGFAGDGGAGAAALLDRPMGLTLARDVVEEIFNDDDDSYYYETIHRNGVYVVDSANLVRMRGGC